MRRRYVATPSGDRWVVERRWLVDPPRWLGFRFGRKPRNEQLEPTIVVRREDAAGGGHYRRPRHGDGTGVVHGAGDAVAEAIWWGSRGAGRSGGGWGGGGAGEAAGQASGSVAREASGMIGRGGSASAPRGISGSTGGADSGGGLSDMFDVDGDNPVAVVLAVVAAIAALVAVVFLALPGVLFALQFLAWGAIVGGTMAWRSMTGRPWIVEAREDRPAPLGMAWEVVGWRNSAATIDDVVADLQRGDRPDPTDCPAVEVRVIEALPGDPQAPSD